MCQCQCQKVSVSIKEFQNTKSNKSKLRSYIIFPYCGFVSIICLSCGFDCIIDSMSCGFDVRDCIICLIPGFCIICDNCAGFAPPRPPPRPPPLFPPPLPSTTTPRATLTSTSTIALGCFHRGASQKSGGYGSMANTAGQRQRAPLPSPHIRDSSIDRRPHHHLSPPHPPPWWPWMAAAARAAARPS